MENYFNKDKYQKKIGAGKDPSTIVSNIQSDLKLINYKLTNNRDLNTIRSLAENRDTWRQHGKNIFETYLSNYFINYQQQRDNRHEKKEAEIRRQIAIQRELQRQRRIALEISVHVHHQYSQFKFQTLQALIILDTGS